MLNIESITLPTNQEFRMRFCRAPFLTAALAVTCGLAAPAAKSLRAQEPVAIISIAPLDRFNQDISYVLEAANFGSLAPVYSMYGDFYTKGIDKSKPIGIQVTLNGQVPSPIICIPVTSTEDLLGAIAGLGIESDDLGDGMVEILPPNGPTIFGKTMNGWLYLAQSEDELSGALPEDPVAMLGKLPDTYTLAVRLSVQALPEDMKTMVGEQMRIGFANGMAEQPGQTDEEKAKAAEMGEAQIAQIEQLLTELDQVFLGWSIDASKQLTFFDVGAQFLEGSKLAAQADLAANTTTDYKSLVLPNSAVSFRFASEIPESDRPLAIQNFRNSMEQGAAAADKQDLPPELKELLTGLLDGLGAIAEKTINEGKFDGAGSLSLADSTPRLLIGGRVADGAALAAEFKKLAAGLPPEAANDITFDFDYETYNGMNLHRITTKVKIADPAAKQMFGDQIELIIGTSDKGFMVSMDPSGDAAVKSAVDAMANSKNEA
ncbi:MAG: hypothetical protein WBD37_14885, partial [Anderseniella sp.]